MIRDIFTNKWIIGAVFLLLIFAGACYWYYQQGVAIHKRAVEQADKVFQEWEADKAKTPTTADKEVTNTPAESTTSTAEKPITDEVTPDEVVVTEPADIPKMSKFGLGPLPEIPKDWNDPYLWKGCKTIESELLTRVIIKMHNEGIYDKYSSVGIDYGTGLIAPIEHGSLLVELETDKNGEQRIWGVKGHPSIVKPYECLSEIPSHIKVVTREEISFDPYEYLGLQR